MSQHNWVKEKQRTKKVKGMKATEAFLFSHPVFSWSEWKKEVGDGRSEKTLRNLLSYYLKRGRLKRVDGVYCVVPPLTEPSTFIPDRFLVASKLSPDSVLSYHLPLKSWVLPTKSSPRPITQAFATSALSAIKGSVMSALGYLTPSNQTLSSVS
jgi:predicted transcriptional regulator of viral defense system